MHKIVEIKKLNFENYSREVFIEMQHFGKVVRGKYRVKLISK